VNAHMSLLRTHAQARKPAADESSWLLVRMMQASTGFELVSVTDRLTRQAHVVLDHRNRHRRQHYGSA